MVEAADIDGGSSDPDGDALTFLIDGQGSLTFTCAERGANAVTLTVDDGNGGSDQCPATVTVESAGTCVDLRQAVLGDFCQSAAGLSSLAGAIPLIDAAIAAFLDGGAICDVAVAACRLAILQELLLVP